MASIFNVYSALKSLSNKEQKGFITPAVFNSFAPIAQVNVYNEMFEDFTTAKQQSRANLDSGRDRSKRKLVAEDVSIYIKDVALEQLDGNLFQKPGDLGKVISIRTEGEPGTGDSRSMCEMLYNVERMNAILGSNLSTPTDSFPVAMISKDIEIFPDTITEAYITYYALPTSYEVGTSNASELKPQINFNASGIIDLSASRDFMIPKEYEAELVAEMCKMLGVRLRDVNLQQFGSREEASE
jgi:hypothetical protein